MDRVIGDWLENGASRLPADARRGMLQRIVATPQRRHRTIRLRAQAHLVAASFATAAALALVFVGIVAVPRPSAPPDPASSLSPSSGPDSARRVVPASRFLRGFEYDMPRSEMEVRVVDWGLVGYDAGEYAVNVWMVQDVPADPCSSDGLRRPISNTSEFVDYLRRVPGLEVGPPGYRHVDGILATDLRLVAAEVRPCFHVAYLIDPMSGTTASLTNDREARLTILEVDGRIVVFEAASSRGLDAWLPEIDAFLASIDFLPPY